MPRIKIDTGLHLYYETEGEGEAVILVQGLDRDHRGMALQKSGQPDKAARDLTLWKEHSKKN